MSPTGDGSVFSQTTIAFSDFQNLLSNSRRMEYTIEYFPGPSVDLGIMSPAGQDFDFSAVPNESKRDSVLLTFVDPAGQPGESHFPGTTLCTPQSFNPTDSSEITLVDYYLLQPDGFYLMGRFIRQVVSTILDTAVVQRFSPKRLLIPLPLTYGVTRTAVDTAVFDSLNNDFSVTVTTIECDGWGDVTLPLIANPAPMPAATAVNCLRLTHAEVTEQFYNGSFGEREKLVEVEYITPDGVLLTIGQNDSDYIDGTAAVTTINYSLRQGTTGVRIVSDGLPQRLTLSQNYPNPFNPVTTIAFSVPSAGRVRIEMADLLGRVVLTPVDAAMPPGSYRVQFDAGRLSSGIYIYRLTAGGTAVSKKMMVVK